MKRLFQELGSTPWGLLPTELVQDICSFLVSTDLAAASLTCRAWRTAACALVTHITLPLNHPLLLAGPVKGWEVCVARMSPLHPAALLDAAAGGAECSPSSVVAVTPLRPSISSAACGLGPAEGDRPSSAVSGESGVRGFVTAGPSPSPAFPYTPSPVQPQAASTLPLPPLPRLRTDFPCVKHITLVHNSLLHRAQVHAALSTLRVLWPTVRGLSVHDSVTWDLPLDYSALGVMTHITSLELLFQGQGGMDEAGQPMYRASMPHLCRLSRLKELCMKWIIGYDVDSFLDFDEVYALLASLVKHAQLRSLQFGGENINAEGARQLASITSLETLNLVCDARPASPLHLLDLLTMPRLTRLELMHVCPDHAWNLEPLPGEPSDPLVELGKRSAVLAASPLRCLALSLSPRCQALVSRALPMLPHLHSLSVRVTSSEEEEALCSAFRAMAQTGPTTPSSPPQPQQELLPPPLPPPPQAAAGPVAAAAALPLPPQPSTPPARSGTSGQAGPLSPAPALPPPPPLRSLRLETAELGPELINSVALLTALTSLQLPRGLPTGETVEYGPEGPPPAAGLEPVQPHSKFSMAHLSALGRLTNLRRLMLQLDSPAETPPAFVDSSLVSVLMSFSSLESLHLSTWNLVGQDPSAEALGPFPERPEQQEENDASRDHLARGAGPAAPGGCSQSRDGETEAERCRMARSNQHLPGGPGDRAPTSITAGEVSGANVSASTSDGGTGGGAGIAAATGPRRGRAAAAPCLTPLPTWAWQGLRSLSLTHWPCVYGKLREAGLPHPGKSYSLRLEDLPSALEALLLVRGQLVGSRPPAGLRHLWLSDCISTDCPLPQLLTGMTNLETLVLRWPSNLEEQEPASEAAARQRTQLVAAVASLRGLRTLGLGGIRCQDVPSLAPISLLRHLMLEPMQPQRPAGEAPSAQRDLTLLDQLMALPAGALAGLRTLWLPNWAMPIKQLLQWQQMLQAAMPLVVLRVIEYDVVWTVPTPVMHVARVEAPSSLLEGAPSAAARGGGGSDARGGGEAGSLTPGAGSQRHGLQGLGGGGSQRHAGSGLDGQELEWWHIGCWTVQ